MTSLLFALLSAFLYILAFPNFNLWWLAWIAFIPLILITRHASPRKAFFWGWFSGTLAYAGILYWIIPTYQADHLSMALTLLCLGFLAGYVGLFWGAWTWFLAVIASEAKQSVLTDRHGPQTAGGLAMTVGGAAAWVALEYLRTHLFSGFPWALLGDSQAKVLPIIQIASFTGVYGVSFLIVLTNLTLAVIASEAKQSVRSPRSRWSLAMTAGVLLTSYAFGRYELSHATTLPRYPAVKVALLQGSIDQYKKWNKEYVDDIERTYEGLVAQAAKDHPELIVWPETSVPGYLLQDPPLREWLTRVILPTHTWHLVGAPIESGHNTAYNEALLMRPDGNVQDMYAKIHLVPFGEMVPWADVLGRYIKVLNDLGGFTPGNKFHVLMENNYKLGPNICYEAIFPDLVRRSVKAGAEVIINITNDGWYMKTAAPFQHWAPNVFRAVENRRWVLRADNTGISGIIDPTGHVIRATGIFVPTIITGTFEPRTDLTFYSRYGDVFAWLCALSVFGILIYSRRETRASHPAVSTL